VLAVNQLGSADPPWFDSYHLRGRIIPPISAQQQCMWQCILLLPTVTLAAKASPVCITKAAKDQQHGSRGTPCSHVPHCPAESSIDTSRSLAVCASYGVSLRAMLERNEHLPSLPYSRPRLPVLALLLNAPLHLEKRFQVQTCCL
jgi:hypothetical protein